MNETLCPACHRTITLKKDGTFRQHQAWLSGTNPPDDRQFPPPCIGGGRTASEAREWKLALDSHRT